MTSMGTPENGFRKPKIGDPERKEPMTVRAAVTQWGDDWRLMFEGYHFIRREHMEQDTHDSWDFHSMVMMERGEKPRIRVVDTL